MAIVGATAVAATALLVALTLWWAWDVDADDRCMDVSGETICGGAHP